MATGTPGGVGHAREPARYLTAGSEMETRISGLGELRNRITEPQLERVSPFSDGR